MSRRAFIAAAIGVLASAGRASAERDAIRRIGWLDLDPPAANRASFERSIAAKGWIESKTFTFVQGKLEGRSARLAQAAAELVRLPVDIVVAAGTPEALAASDATKAVPIVFAGVDDPVAQKLVASLARPGRNVTGVARGQRELCSKLLSLVRELGSAASRVAVLLDPADPDHRLIGGNLRAIGKAASMSVSVVEVHGYMDVEPGVVSIRRQGHKVLVVPPSGMLVPRWIADLALTNGLALVSTSAGYTSAGGLFSCTDDWDGVYERVATYVDRILKGAKPAELPVELPTKFTIMVNRKTAAALKLTLPQAMLQQADSVIE